MKTRFFIALSMVFFLVSCGSEGNQTELTVFAAASLTETLTEIGEAYTADHPDITLRFNFDSSGTLQTQIEEGAVCDVFLSAGQAQMDALESAGLVDTASRLDLLENTVVLAVPENNPKELTSWDDWHTQLSQGTLFLAMGNSDVPVGQYSQEIFSFYHLDEQALAQQGCITYGSNVKEVALQVSEGSVDCGLLYATDATAQGLDVVAVATHEMCPQVVYPACVVAGTAHEAESQAFLDALSTPEAMAVFAAVGFR